MTPIDFRPVVLREVAIYCENRVEAVESIKGVAEALSFAVPSQTEQKQFWRSLKADLEEVRRSIPQEHVPASLNHVDTILKAALEEIIRQEAKLEGSARFARLS